MSRSCNSMPKRLCTNARIAGRLHSAKSNFICWKQCQTAHAGARVGDWRGQAIQKKMASWELNQTAIAE